MIKVRDIAYTRYQAPDLPLMESFLADFGMTRAARTDRALFMRGHGTMPYSHITELGESKGLGLGLVVSQPSDLERIVDKQGGRIEENDESGVGRILRIKDPAGFRVDLLDGFDVATPLPVRERIPINAAGSNGRRGTTVRLPGGPSHVRRLGHVVLLMPQIQSSLAFYRDLLGMRISDSHYGKDSDDLVFAFLHCGLGNTYVDHHTIGIGVANVAEPRIDHSAYEVIDWDDLMMGNRHLMAASHTHAWGIGRHIQGSQVFDYWRDPWGNKIEHWTDGDQVNDDYPTSHQPFSADTLSQWSPPLTPDFFS